MRILNDRQETLLKEERRLLNSLQKTLLGFGAETDDQKTLDQSIQQLDELFLLVVVGEFNAGKSAFINALLGTQFLQEGVTPTTTQISILRYGPEQEQQVLGESMQSITMPLEFLTDIHIVDTPGTNAVIREHEIITAQFVPRSDLVLFITSADRPFTESERIFLERIRDWGKKVVIVINKIDILQSQADLEQVQTFVMENAHLLLGITPEVFPVSARLAQRAKLGEPALWEVSRFQPLETYIYETLDERGRVQLKFLNPLGIGSHLAEKYLGVIDSRLGTLKEDFDALEDVDAQLSLYKEDMHRDFDFRMADIENILYDLEQRGNDYFDETMRIARVFDLMKKERIQREFEGQVVGDVSERIDRRVTELIDWLVDSDLRQWQAVTEHVAARRQEHKDRIVGDPGVGSFHYDRERLIEGVAREARHVVDTYDKSQEARTIAEGAQTAVAAAAALEVVGVGLGTLVTIMATTVAADVTGVLLASLIAALGIFVIPARRRQAKREMHSKIAALREQLVQSLRTHFQREIERSLQHVHEAIAPYSRFVRAEREKLTETQGELTAVKDGLNRIKVQINELA